MWCCDSEGVVPDVLKGLQRHIHSDKPDDFTVWHHTWRKSSVNFAVLTDNGAGLRMSFPVVFHTDNCAVHTGNPTVSSVPPDTTMALSQGTQPFIAIHSADKNRMIYSFSNTTCYSIFYSFFSSFRITIWPMGLVISKRQSVFIHYSHTHKKTHTTDKTGGKIVLCQRIFSSGFRAAFFTQLHCTV
jgi:hypothetical protein